MTETVRTRRDGNVLLRALGASERRLWALYEEVQRASAEVETARVLRDAIKGAANSE